MIKSIVIRNYLFPKSMSSVNLLSRPTAAKPTTFHGKRRRRQRRLLLLLLLLRRRPYRGC
jgi:hypothetical protein